MFSSLWFAIRIHMVVFVTSLALFLTCDHVAIAQSQDAQNPVSQPLWPDGVAEHTESQPAEGDVPELLVTIADSEQTTAGIVILPGGGYRGLAISHEGFEIAQWFKSLGISSVICKYRVRGKGNDGYGYGHPYPMLDAQRAIQTMRANASDWNIDPDRIGVIGFSAGGHLASTVSTKFAKGDPQSSDPVKRVSSRPDFSILCYPVIAFGKSFTHAGSQRNLLGSDASPELIASLSNEDQVSEKTPPTFLFHTSEDPVVLLDNALQYASACHRSGVDVELHVFPKGRHGLGLAKGSEGAQQWPKLCENWLRNLGICP